MDEFRDKKRNAVIEAVKSCSRVLPNHEWVSVFSLIMHVHDILGRSKFDIECSRAFFLGGVLSLHKSECGKSKWRKNGGDVEQGY